MKIYCSKLHEGEQPFAAFTFQITNYIYIVTAVYVINLQHINRFPRNYIVRLLKSLYSNSCCISQLIQITVYWVSQQKRPAFKKILLPEYQSNKMEDCLILSQICQIRFRNLPGFNWPFLPVEIRRRFSVESPFRKPAKRSENIKQNIPVLLPSNNDSWMCSCTVFCPHGRMESP